MNSDSIACKGEAGIDGFQYIGGTCGGIGGGGGRAPICGRVLREGGEVRRSRRILGGRSKTVAELISEGWRWAEMMGSSSCGMRGDILYD